MQLAMSGQELETVRETVRLINANDLDGLRPHLHPEIVVWGPAGWPERGPFEGPDSVLRQYRRLGEDYEEHHTEVLELEHLGVWVVGKMAWRTRGRSSGIESTTEVWFAHRFREGRIIETRWVWERDDALAAAGASAL
jgi:ketosteroid isomerase-like protein